MPTLICGLGFSSVGNSLKFGGAAMCDELDESSVTWPKEIRIRLYKQLNSYFACFAVDLRDNRDADFHKHGRGDDPQQAIDDLITNCYDRLPFDKLAISNLFEGLANYDPPRGTASRR